MKTTEVPLVYYKCVNIIPYSGLQVLQTNEKYSTKQQSCAGQCSIIGRRNLLKSDSDKADNKEQTPKEDFVHYTGYWTNFKINLKLLLPAFCTRCLFRSEFDKFVTKSHDMFRRDISIVKLFRRIRFLESYVSQ